MAEVVETARTPRLSVAEYEDAEGARLSVELQLSYATGVVAGTSFAAYQIVEYGRQTGFTSVWDTYMVCSVAMVLEMVTAGMVLHIMYRGFWIAMRLLVETRSDEGLATAELIAGWEKEIRALDGTCQAFFFRTFRFLYMGMIFGVVAVGVRLIGSSGQLNRIEGWTILGLLSVMPLVRVLRRWAGSSRLGPWLQSINDRLVSARRLMGLWWLQSDPRSVSLLKVMGFVVVANVLVGVNLSLMAQAELQSDKAVYFQSANDKVVLSFHYGGFVPGPEAKITLGVRCSAMRSPESTEAFHLLGPGRYVAVLNATDFKPGPAEMQVDLGIRYGDKKAKLSITPEPAFARFLVER